MAPPSAALASPKDAAECQCEALHAAGYGPDTETGGELIAGIANKVAHTQPLRLRPPAHPPPSHESVRDELPHPHFRSTGQA